jgi:hypothetical protein
MNRLLQNWTLIEEHEGSFVFENNDHTFNVFIDFNDKTKVPYTIGYEQLEGDYELIDFEDGTFKTTAETKDEALNKAVLLMQFVNIKLYGSDDLVAD